MSLPSTALPAAAIACAVCIDLALGEPPSALHPVVWMGSFISAGVRRAPSRGRVAQLAAGAALLVVVPVTFAAASAAPSYLLRSHPVLELVATVLILKSTFALRALGAAALVVRDALRVGDGPAARTGLSSLCSRDARALDEPALVGATIESVAENASDSFVAPLFYFALFGLPGAVAYRAVNTLDAMVGYRGRFEHLGKASARLDDLLNLIPSRLTAALLLAAGWACGRDVGRGWRTLLRDGGRTESPNAGRPMATMAGLLGIELAKEGHYRLGDPIAPARAADIDAAWRLVRVAALLAAALAVLARASLPALGWSVPRAAT
jgi:adenosylcobinamide-phosphate synthase